MDSDFKIVAEDIRRDVEAVLFRLGVLCRVFSRGKTFSSLEEKLSKEPGKYSSFGKKVQDCVGVRIVLYFVDDIQIVKDVLTGVYEQDRSSSMIDTLDPNEFSVARFNLIFKIPDEYMGVFSSSIRGRAIDSTFEIQIRSVLSEGWHEVEHDLRYKCADHWKGHVDLVRMLNGVLATLETSEWSMGQIFDSLAFRHYKNRNWTAMLHSKLRLRIQPDLDASICAEMECDRLFAKQMYKMDRSYIVRSFFVLKPRIPLNLDSIVYFWNYLSSKNENIIARTPALMLEAFSKNESVDGGS